MAFDPRQCQVLAVGKSIAQLEPFLAQHGYKCVGKETGVQALEVLGQQSFHIVLMEINLRDIELRDFYEEAIKTQTDAAFLIMAPPNDAEDIVSALVAGADGYIAVPPDEGEMFRELERQGAAAIARKEENPTAVPGVQDELDELQEQVTKYRGHAENLQKQVVALREAKESSSEEIAELNKKLNKEVKGTSAGPTVPPGHKVVKIEQFEELESKATFIEFLESENDELKAEIERLRAATGDEGEFGESTGAMQTPPPGMLSGSDEELLMEDDDDDELLVLDDDDDDDDDIAAAATAMKSPAPPPKPTAPAPMPAPTPAVGSAADNDGDFEENTDALLALVADSSEEDLVLDDTPAPIPPVVITTPTGAPPASAGDGFENLNTDALIALASEEDSDEMNDDDLQALLDDLE